MFEGFEVSQDQRHCIMHAWGLLVQYTRDEHRSVEYMRKERDGYGRENDSIPQIAAMGLCLQWFVEGLAQPDYRLAKAYYMRPAAIWFTGMGAEYHGKLGSLFIVACSRAVAAYQAAFKAMQARDQQAIAEACNVVPLANI